MMGNLLPLLATAAATSGPAAALGPVAALQGSAAVVASGVVAWMFLRGRRPQSSGLSLESSAEPAAPQCEAREEEYVKQEDAAGNPAAAAAHAKPTTELLTSSDASDLEATVCLSAGKAAESPAPAQDPVADAVLAAWIEEGPEATEGPETKFDPDATVRSTAALLGAMGPGSAPLAASAPAAAYDPDETVRSAVTKFAAAEEAANAAQPTAAGASATKSPLNPVGAGPLLADASRLVPNATSAEGTAGRAKPPGRGTNGGGAFQPAGRFTRSQQAFLHVPVVLTGTRQGAEFREENRTLILLPQGAVLKTQLPLAAKDDVTLLNPATRQEAPCRVFGTTSGADGKLLVEVEFAVPIKNFWPVSFPAWPGDVSDPGRKHGRGARGADPERTTATVSSRS